MKEPQKLPPQLKPLERKTRPPRKSKVDTGGMLSLATMLVSLGALSIALGGGLILIFDILDKGLDNSMDGIPVKLFVLAVTFLFSWVTGLISIRGFKNRLYPIIVKLYIWGCLSAAGVLYIKIIQKLYLQEYGYPKLGKYVIIMLGILFVLLCLHLLLEEHDPRQLAIPPLIISVVHLFVIVYHYVFDASGVVKTDALYVIGDFMVFLLMIDVSGLMLTHNGILSPVREMISEIFSRDRKPEINENGVR
jgi:hypothetical protein